MECSDWPGCNALCRSQDCFSVVILPGQRELYLRDALYFIDSPLQVLSHLCSPRSLRFARSKTLHLWAIALCMELLAEGMPCYTGVAPSLTHLGRTESFIGPRFDRADVDLLICCGEKEMISSYSRNKRAGRYTRKSEVL